MILFANNEQTNEQFTDFIFTPQYLASVYFELWFQFIAYFPNFIPFLCDWFTILLYFIELFWLRKYIFLKKIDFLEKIQQFGTKIVEFDEQLFISFLFTNNEQFILLTNNEYSRTNKKHTQVFQQTLILPNLFFLSTVRPSDKRGQKIYYNYSSKKMTYR